MDELTIRFAQFSEKHGPKVVDSVLSAARMEAWSTLVAGALALGVSGAFIYGGNWLYKKSNEPGWDNDWMVVAFALFIIGGLVAIPGIWSCIDPRTWSTIIHPEYWVAKRVFSL